MLRLSEDFLTMKDGHGFFSIVPPGVFNKATSFLSQTDFERLHVVLTRSRRCRVHWKKQLRPYAQHSAPLFTKFTSKRALRWTMQEGIDAREWELAIPPFRRGATTLMNAIFTHDLDIARFCLERCKSEGSDTEEMHGLSPLHFSAILNSALPTIPPRAAGGIGPPLSLRHLEDRDEFNRTPLHWAAMMGHIDVVKFLCVNGADKGAQCQANSTPLHKAAAYDHLDVVQYLCDRGADVEVSNNEELTPLHLATMNGHFRVLQCLYEHGADKEAMCGDGWTPVMSAASEGHLYVVKYLCDKGASTDARDNGGNAPLHAAVQQGYLDVVQYLCEQGADIHARNSEGKKPIHEAVRCGKLEVFKYLLGRGNLPDVFESSTDGPLPATEIPLVIAAFHGHDLSVDYLCTINANIEERSLLNNRTPFCVAAANGHLSVMHVLYRHGADMFLSTEEGTALHLAAIGGYLDVVKYLMRHGADMEARGVSERTPLHLACSHNWIMVVKYLIQKGADVRALDAEQCTPLHLAVEESHDDIVKFLCEETSACKNALTNESPLDLASNSKVALLLNSS